MDGMASRFSKIASGVLNARFRPSMDSNVFENRLPIPSLTGVIGHGFLTRWTCTVMNTYQAF